MRVVLFVVILDYLISLIAFIIQMNYPDDSIEYFMSVDYSWALRMVIWAIGFYLIMNKKIHKEYHRIASNLIGFCIVIFILDFIKNIMAYEDIIVWKESFAIKRVVHTLILMWAVIKTRQLNRVHNFINN